MRNACVTVIVLSLLNLLAGSATAVLVDSFENYDVTLIDLPGDANSDYVVNEEDAAIVATNWLSSGANWEMGDFNDDGSVDDTDATIMAVNWLNNTSSEGWTPEGGWYAIAYPETKFNITDNTASHGTKSLSLEGDSQYSYIGQHVDDYVSLSGDLRYSSGGGGGGGTYLEAAYWLGDAKWAGYRPGWVRLLDDGVNRTARLISEDEISLPGSEDFDDGWHHIDIEIDFTEENIRARMDDFDWSEWKPWKTYRRDLLPETVTGMNLVTVRALGFGCGYDNIQINSLATASVPEPSLVMMLGVGLACCAFLGRIVQERRSY